MTVHKPKPPGITALTILFVVGTSASLLSALSLTFPGSFLEPIWLLNTHAREGFSRMGSWAIVLMAVVCIACISTAIGLWRGVIWGYWFAVVMLVLNLVGDLVNGITGMQRKAIAGVPVVLLILVYLMRKRTRDYFSGNSSDD